jgi:5-methylcytosine-specific restriction endonuclease McrA
MNPLYPNVADRAAHRCEYCRAPELVFNFPFEIEHIIPTCRGGGDAESNLALACRSCNLRKGIRTIGLDAIFKTEISFFNPR